MTDRQDTIAAIGSPPGRGGIGIIRISGPEVLSIANRILVSKLNILSLSTIPTRKLFHAVLKDTQGHKIDEILVAYLPEKRSYTGECSIELNCHGGKAIMAYALEAVIQSGARMAEPGEFTRRAVEKGRINLVQAEAVNEIIHARTKQALHAAWRQMDGALTDKCNELKENLVSIISEIQAVIDFEVQESNNQWKANVADIKQQIDEILCSAEKGRYLTHGCWVVLTGPPNAGKSSLFNSILNVERALVTDTPGTTRDHISEVIDLDGIEVRLSDTAGIRETEDTIEQLSIEKSQKQMKEADVVVYVIDQNNILAEDQKALAIQTLRADGYVLLNKCDLCRHSSVTEFFQENEDKKIIPVSMISKKGLDEFLNSLAEMIHERALRHGNPIITSLRQSRLLMTASESLKKASECLERDGEYDILMFEIQNTLHSLAEIIGEVSDEDILNTIFSKFCIGK